MKVQITVQVDESDGKFFADLMRGAFDWAKYASLNIESEPAVDASWLLRANVSCLSTDK